MGFSVTDQAFSVGGMFLINVALARTQTREEYGVFALCYSIFTFLSGLHNAAILEPYTVYGSGRYSNRFAEYFGLMLSRNVVLSFALTGALSAACLALHWTAPRFISGALLGLSLAVGFLLTGVFLRRVFYIQRRPDLAARISLIFFLSLCLGLGITIKLHWLNSFSAFLICALSWTIAGLSLARELPSLKTPNNFLELVPGYWGEHWKYSRWVLVTAFVFQLTSQGYYWLLAGLVSVKDVADMKAMLILIAPVEQIYIAMNYLILPALAARYAAMNIRGLVAAWKWCLLANTGLMGCFALFILFFGRALAHAMYGGKFDTVASLLPILALWPLIMGIGNTMNAALKATENPRLVFWAYLCSGTVTFLLGVPLVVHFNLRGAVYGLLCSACAYTTALGVGFAFTLRRYKTMPVALG